MRWFIVRNINTEFTHSGRDRMLPMIATSHSAFQYAWITVLLANVNCLSIKERTKNKPHILMVQHFDWHSKLIFIIFELYYTIGVCSWTFVVHRVHFSIVPDPHERKNAPCLNGNTIQNAKHASECGSSLSVWPWNRSASERAYFILRNTIDAILIKMELGFVGFVVLLPPQMHP